MTKSTIIPKTLKTNGSVGSDSRVGKFSLEKDKVEAIVACLKVCIDGNRRVINDQKLCKIVGEEVLKIEIEGYTNDLKYLEKKLSHASGDETADITLQKEFLELDSSLSALAHVGRIVGSGHSVFLGFNGLCEEKKAIVDIYKELLGTFRKDFALPDDISH